MPYPNTVDAPSIQTLIDQALLAGQGYSVTTGSVTTGATNAWLGLELLWTTPSKLIIIYNVVVSSANSGSPVQINQATTTTLDAGLTTNLLASVLNNSGSGPASIVTSVQGSPAATTQASGLIGSARLSAVASTTSINPLLLSSAKIIAPKTTLNIAVYSKFATSGNAASITIDWVEI